MVSHNRRREHKRSVLRERAEYSLVRLLLLPIRLASIRRVRRWGEALGSFLFRLVGRRTRLAVRNFRLAFPDRSEEEARRVVRDCWRHFLGETLVYLRTLDQTPEELLARAELRGRERVEEWIRRGRGIIVYTPHFGSWEAAAAMLSTFDIRFSVVARPLDNRLLHEELYRGRSRAGIEIVPRRAAGRAMMRALSEGQGVVVLPDQAVKPREGILVPFLGRLAWTTPAPARLALRFNAPLIGVFCIPTGDETLRIELADPIFPDELPPEQRNLESITRLINDRISERIRAHPHLWLWMHDRWKGVDAAEARAGS
ncbi:MAG TPA: lysophospholipid acyltransferase family protein [Thermoanaerobaculia bacterium]|nr:lysophospholipid acyltransferase family protein [Thermoanaerobaculia bacterium]